LLAAHFIGFFPVGMIIWDLQWFMAFTALGRYTDSIVRNPVGRTATGASNDNLVGVVHWSLHLIFLYNNASNLVVKDRGLNLEFGMRTAEKKKNNGHGTEVFEFGM
jgi:hypothetical protein